MDLISSFLKCSCWSGHDKTSAACLLYPKKRTLPSATSMSALCQKRTSHRTLFVHSERLLDHRASPSTGQGIVVKDSAGQNLAQPVLLLLLFWMLLFWLPTKSIDVILKSLNFAYRRL